MRWSAHSSRTSLVVVIALVLLLAVLATLQYRWIAQLSGAERVRLQENLDRSSADFCEDFDREIARAFSVFGFNGPSPRSELPLLLGDRLIQWRATAVWPELVKDLTVVRREDPNDVAVLCFDEHSKDLQPCEWDDELLEVRRRLRGSGPRVPVVDAFLPGLVVAIEGGGSRRGGPPEWRPPRDHVIVRFDLDFIVASILPSLAETHFGLNGGLPYLLSVSSIEEPGMPVFQTTPSRPTRVGRPDATDFLFGLRVFPQFSDASHGPPGFRSTDLHSRTEEGRWILAVHHPEGSLEAVVRRTRRRNMAISAATLVMLGVTAVLMVVSTRSARRLARQQMDFVAAVSHELRTPLTAIRSAGQNLADGIIHDPDRVRSYGVLIEREGRRLTEMIGRVLTFAGIRSGRQIHRMEPVDMAEIVQASLEDVRWTLEETGFEVETEIAAGLPRVRGDAAALRRVLTNLIDNATKYAAAGGWLGIRVDFESGHGAGILRVSVSDRGPGIPRTELSSIFEPFQRGADAAGSNNPGSGLGLAVVRSIVEAHGGTIGVDCAPGGGTTFVVRVPAEPTRSADVGDEE